MLLFFLIFSVFLLLLVIFIFRKWLCHFLQLLYVSLKYGRTSHEFLTFFKKNNLISPYNVCVKDNITSHFLIFNTKDENSDEFLTSKAIDFEEIPFMVTSRELIQIKGMPDCMNVETLGDLRFMVIGYNEFIQGLKMKSLYFFLNDRFVMGEFLFTDLLRTKPVALVESISSKYLDGKSIGKEFFYIRDKEENQLNFDFNGFSIAVKYLFRGDHTINSILSGSVVKGDALSEKSRSVLRNEELLDIL